MAIDRGGTTGEGRPRRHDGGRAMAIGGTTTLARTCYNNNNSNSRFINTTAEDQWYHVRPVRQQLVQIDVRRVGSILIERERGIGFIRVAMRASSRRRILVGG